MQKQTELARSDSNVIIVLKLSKEAFGRLAAFSGEVRMSPANCARSLLEDLIADPEFECSAAGAIGDTIQPY